MSTKQELKIEKYTSQLKKINVPVNKVLLETVTKSLGAANYKLDAMFVAARDPKELATVNKNFVMKKLGEKDSEKGMKAVLKAAEKMSGIRKKYRAVFYYILAKKYGTLK